MKGSQAQWIAGLASNLVMVSTGMLFGWATPMIPKFLSGVDSLKLTFDEAAWVVSLLSLGCVFGPLLIKLVVDRMGRKCSLNLIVLPILIYCLVMGLATNVETLYVGRFIGGLAIGGVYSSIPMYLGEIAEDRIRGALGAMMLIMLNLGMLLCFCIGPWVTRSQLSIITSVPPFIFLVVFFWMPETPYYLLMKGKREQAMASLIWLRQTEDVKDEFQEMEDNVRKQQENDTSITELFRTKGNRRAMLICGGVLLFQQASGVIAIQSYAGMIFEQSDFVIPSGVSLIIMGLVKTLAAISSFLVIDVMGRRPLLMLSSVSTSFFLACEGIFFHLKETGNAADITWLPLIGVIGYYITYTIGLGAVPYTLFSELFPTNVKAYAAVIIPMYGSILSLIVSKVYQVVADAVGVHFIFYGFSVMTLFGIIFVYFIVSETKQRSLQDIQDSLNKRERTSVKVCSTAAR